MEAVCPAGRALVREKINWSGIGQDDPFVEFQTDEI